MILSILILYSPRLMTGAECGESATTGVSWQVWRLVIGNCSKTRGKEMGTHLDQHGCENQSVCSSSSSSRCCCCSFNNLNNIKPLLLKLASLISLSQRTSPFWMGLASPIRTLLTLVSGVWSLYFFLSGSQGFFTDKNGKIYRNLRVSFFGGIEMQLVFVVA